MTAKKEKRRAEQSLELLLRHVEAQGFTGYDPMDALNSPHIGGLKAKWPRLAATLFFRYSPLDLRKAFGVEKEPNPKAMGIFLSSYSRLHRAGYTGQDTMKKLYRWLLEHRSQGYDSSCWGYNYPWQDRNRLLPAWTPNIVVTAYVGQGLLDYYEMTKKKEALEVARSACDFILEALPRTEKRYGVCFSYTPVERDMVLNANVLGSSLLARVYSHTGEEKLLEMATRSMDFTMHHQRSSGRWDYSLDPVTGRARAQTDWHQGFILDSLMWYVEAVKPEDKKYSRAIRRGGEFYKRQFTPDGRAYMRHPQLWPVDLHNQAQGITTFSRLGDRVEGSGEYADRILGWTLNNLLAPRGYFYYQKHKWFMNRLPYIRWQAWMLYALSWYLCEGEDFS